MSGRRTRERILDVALLLFNARGEPNVTTNRIAQELEISPGNLHYHFRTKQKLIEELFRHFEGRMLKLLSAPDRRPAEIDDIWLYLHLLFETIGEYRFLYRDLTDLCARYRGLHRRFRAILQLSMDTAGNLCDGLSAAGRMDITRRERAALLRNILLVATYWIAFDTILEPGEEPRPNRAAWQVLSLVNPYLVGEAREQLSLLAEAYLEGR